MKIKTIIGLALIVIGATVVPFGHWVTRISTTMLGSPVYWLGLPSRLVLIALVKTRLLVYRNNNIFTIRTDYGTVRFMWKPADVLPMTAEQKGTLEAWIRAKTTQRIVLRSRICLLAGEGKSNNAIADQLGTSRPTVLLWRQRFEKAGPSGLSEDAPHGLSVQRLSAQKVNAIVEATLHTKPEDATHWSTRTMAKAQGVSHASVARIWDAHGLKPHRIEGFKLSKDKRFVEKLTDVVGVYLNPPDKALVLCVDEKSQVQALDRTQPGLPMKKGRCGTMTHDYKRNGTTCLFAALNVLDGTVIGTCYPRHRNEDS